MKILTIILGVILVIGGILRIVGAVGLIRLRNKAWIWMIILGILMIILGVYGFFHPLVNAIAIGWMMGFFIIFQGFNLIGMGSTWGGGSDNNAAA